MKGIILFDIDYVLVNTDVIKKELRLPNGSYDENKFSEKILYPETNQVLKKLKHHYDLGIWSQGKLGFQKAKLVKSGIINFFNPELIFITETDKTELVSKIKQQLDGKAIYLIEDRLIYLEAFRQRIPKATCVWMKQGKYQLERPRDYNFKSDFQVNSLKEVERVLGLVFQNRDEGSCA